MSQIHFTLRRANGDTIDRADLNFEDENRDGQISTEREAHHVLNHFPRGHESEYTAVVESRTYHYRELMDMRNASAPVQTLFTLPHIRGTLNVPGSTNLPGGISFHDLNAPINIDFHGQQLRGTADTHGNFRITALHGPDGRPNQITFNLSATDAPSQSGNRNIQMTFALVTEASLLEVQRNSDQNILIFNLAGLRFGPLSNGQTSGLSGSLRRGQDVLPFDGVSFQGNPPPLQLRVNFQTDEVTLFGQPLPVPQDVEENVQTVSEWLALPPEFWRRRLQILNQSSTLVHLSEQVMRVPLINRMLPSGTGDFYTFLPSNHTSTEGTSEVFFRADSLTRSGSVLIPLVISGMRRGFSNPPPRPSDDGEPLIIGYNQNPQGTLYFLNYRNEDGSILRDPSLEEEVNAALGRVSGINDTFMNDRIELPDLLNTLTNNLAISGHLSRETLTDLMQSYLHPQNGIVQRRLGHRLLISLSHLVADEHNWGLNDLLEVQQGRRKIGAHEFVDNRFRLSPTRSGGDGLDIQYRFVLNMPPEEAQNLLWRGSPQNLDPWVSESHFTPTSPNHQEGSLTILGQSLPVIRELSHSGSVLTMTEHLSNERSDTQFSRVIRLLPVTHQGRTETLVLMDECLDLPGREINRPYPRLERPNSRSSFGNLTSIAASGVLVAGGDHQVDNTALSSDRFAYMMSNLERMRRNQTAAVEASELIALNTNSRTSSIRTMDYLEYQQIPQGDPILLISDEPRSEDVAYDLEERLHIPANVSRTWLMSRHSPVPDATNNIRFIPIRELWQATDLDEKGISFESFVGLSQTLLAPPHDVAETMSHLTSTKDRYLIFLQELSEALGQGPGSVLVQRDGRYPMNFRIFNSRSFHAVVSPGNTEQEGTADSLVSLYVPVQNTQLSSGDIANISLHAEFFRPRSFGGIRDSAEIPLTSVPNAHPGRRYLSAAIALGPYTTETLLDIVRMPGQVSIAPWNRASIPHYENIMLENSGAWIIIPVEQNQRVIGYYVGRYSITNIANIPDTDPLAANTARTQLPEFLNSLVHWSYRTAAARIQNLGRPEAASTNNLPSIEYYSGRSIDHNGRDYPN